MLEKCKGIVLNTINYGEKSVVLKCYTNLFGLQSYLIQGVKGAKSGIKPSHLMPLSLLELEVYHQQNKNLQRIKELRCIPVLNHLHFDLHKSTLALFLGELLTKSLREEDQFDTQLFDFVFNSIQMIDLTEDSLVNIPVFFMVHLSKFLGFFPKANFSPEYSAFSLYEGVFVKDATRTEDFCVGEVSKALYQFTQSTFTTIQQHHFNAAIRKELLQKMIRYYQLHLMVFGELKSPAILHEILIG